MAGEQPRGRPRRLAAALARLDSRPGLIKGAQALRRLLPGDTEYGDPLSVAGNEPSSLIGQRIAQATSQRPSALREAGFGALQVWQALSEAQGRGRGDRELAILFTDLAGFSDWALQAGDTRAVELLRRVGKQLEPPLESNGGTIVKRLGDGLMVVFDEPGTALEAACQAADALGEIEIDGYRPRLRAGLHVGKPRALGGDYFGVDVNIAARVAEAAGPEEVLISETARRELEEESVELRRRWRFQAKGAPRELKVYAARVVGQPETQEVEMTEREHELDERDDDPTTSSATGPEEASGPPGGGELDEESLERSEDKLDQAGGGH